MGVVTWPMAIYAFSNAVAEGFRFLQTEQGKQVIADLREGRLEAERTCNRIATFIEGLAKIETVNRPAPRT